MTTLTRHPDGQNSDIREIDFKGTLENQMQLSMGKSTMLIWYTGYIVQLHNK